jgi:inner membrane protein
VPSIIAHPAVAAALAPWLARRGAPWTLVVAGAICAIVPDLDVLGMRFGVRYESMLGHRGLSHSVCFAAFLAGIVAAAMPRVRAKLGAARVFGFLFVCTASHGVLDAFTNGGQGVAFLAPFSAERWFAPWRPIQVSPLSIAAFFDGRAYAILASELRWVFAPCAAIGLAGAMLGARFRRKA